MTINAEELQKIIDAAEPEQRLDIVKAHFLESGLVFKQRLVANQVNEPLPRHIVGLGTSSATIQSSADRVQNNQKIRLAYSPLQNGPYSVSSFEVRGNGSLSQPVVAQISGLAPDTTYYFVVQTVNRDGSIADQSNEASFRTLSHTPFVRPATDVRMTTAEICGSTKHISASDTTKLFYAKDGDEFEEVGTDSAILTKLIPNTTYNYFLQVLGGDGLVLDESPVRSFTTLDYVAECTVEEVKTTSAILKGAVNFVPDDQGLRIAYKKTGKGSEWQHSTTTSGSNSRDQFVLFNLKDLGHTSSYVARTQVVEGSKVLYESKDTKFKTGSFELTIISEHVLAATADITGAGRYVEDGYSLLLEVSGHSELKEGNGSDRLACVIEAENLKPDTKHVVSLKVLKGDNAVDSVESTFLTNAHNAEATDVVNIRDRSATLTGKANFIQRNGHVRFAWGKEGQDYDAFSPLMFGDTSEQQTFAYMAFGLEPATEYRFVLQMIATDGVTVTDESDSLSFVTATVKRRKA